MAQRDMKNVVILILHELEQNGLRRRPRLLLSDEKYFNLYESFMLNVNEC